MLIGIISLFPEMFHALSYGIVGRAVEDQRLQLHYFNPRDYTNDNYHRVDDTSYGGGPGMVMKALPLQQAIRVAKEKLGKSARVIYASPQGKLLTHARAKMLSLEKSLIFIAGRYEGIDQRVLETEVDEEYSIGDYVLTGGELPIMVMVDVMTRFLPGAVGDAESVNQDSFEKGVLDYPHYTKPAIIEKFSVPEVLLLGNHAAIMRWRTKQALGQTWLKRPDLLSRLTLDAVEQSLLTEFINEYEESCHDCDEKYHSND